MDRATPEPRPDAAEDGLLARVTDSVSAQPDAVAVVDEHGEHTFAAIAHRAGVVAARVAASDLRRWTPSTDDTEVEPVAVLAGHGVDTVAAVLGVIAAGSPVVVLDGVLPDARLRQYLERAGTRTVLADVDRLDRAAGLADRAVPLYGDGVAVPPGEPDDRARAGLIVPDGRPEPDVSAPAVLVFTSGTTGRPKGVVYDQRFFSRSAYNVSLHDGTFGRDDVLASVLPLGFSAGLDNTLAGLQVGALQLMRDTRGLSPADFVDWIDEAGVTAVNLSPTLGRAIVAGMESGRVLKHLRAITLTGEAAHGSDVEALRTVVPPGCYVSNRWGSTETGMSALYAMPAGQPVPSGQLPVGKPVYGLELGIESPDPDGEQVVIEGTGTVTITSAYIGRRYWRDPERTAAGFTELPDGRRSFRSADVGRIDEAGDLLLLGRRDHSVKIRGYLVEPGEVEAALFGLSDVREAVVVGTHDGPRTRLVAYVVSDAERPAASAIRGALRAVLPTYMVPETVVFLAKLPRNERGKVDRSGLPAAPELVPGGSRPRDDWEDVVAQTWARVLGLPEVGVEDDFFELGGDSLAAQALCSAVVNDLGIPAKAVDPTLLVAAPTVASFAARLRRPAAATAHPTLVPLRSSGTRAPLFCVAGGGGLALGFLAISRHLDPDIPVWGLQAKGVEHGGIPDWSVRTIARRHIAAIRTVAPHGPYHLAGHSFGGLVVLEIAHQLRAAGEQVAQLTILDSLPPGSAPPPGEIVGGGPLRRLRDIVGLAATGIVPNPQRGHYWRFHRQAMTLTARYRPAPWDGPTTLLVVDGPERHLRDDWSGWLTGEVTTLAIPGDHNSMLRDPHAEVVAAAMSR